jgi:hypothetical protein
LLGSVLIAAIAPAASAAAAPPPLPRFARLVTIGDGLGLERRLDREPVADAAE